MLGQRFVRLGVAVTALALGGCGSASEHAAYDAPGSVPHRPAPALRLRNYDGRTVDLRRYRGRAVLVTFIYANCPDVCPLIVGNLHTALRHLGPGRRKVRVVAVSTDPRGDTPKTVRAFLRAHQMVGRMDYLVGSRRQLVRVWARWGIGVRRDEQTPERVEHSALIYGITGRGRIAVTYPADFKPGWIVHDVPLLAVR